MLAATQTTVANPRCARVLLPVDAVPTLYIVTPEPCTIVILAAELLYTLTLSPALNIDAGTVTFAFELIHFPASVKIKE